MFTIPTIGDFSLRTPYLKVFHGSIFLLVLLVREREKAISSPISYYCCPIKVFQWEKILFKIVCNGYGVALKEKHIEWNLSEKFYNAIDVLCCFFF